MPPEESTMTIDQADAAGTGLDSALGRLERALREAAEAAAALRELTPGTSRAGFDSAREAALSAEPATLRIPRTGPGSLPAPASVPPGSGGAADVSGPASGPDGARAPRFPQILETGAETLTSFRLEFESDPGPLDLRAVDDAVSDHPSVRDVALIDYDGRKATLKVWVTAATRPSDVQDALRERAAQLFPAHATVQVLALNGVA
jgi:hypothetical protein